MHIRNTHLRNRLEPQCLWRHWLLRRHGMTMVELLIVIAIIVILTTILIPVAKDSFEGRDIREASRMINAYFAGAQARAAELGRPVGVWIERNNGDAGRPGESFQLFMAEVPSPYSGDTFDARAMLLDIHTWGNDMNWGIAGVDDDGNGITDDISEAGASGSDDVPLTDGMCESALFNFTSGSLSSLVKVNDFIRFSFKGPLYEITKIQTNAGFTLVNFRNPQASWMVGPDFAWGVAGIDDDGDGMPDNFSERGWPRSDDRWISPPGPQHSWDPSNNGWSRVPFQIIRRPQKSIVAPMTLPTGVVIDLTVSGFGVSSGSSYGLATSDVLALAPANTTLSNNPIVVVFNPNGSMERVYLGTDSIRPTSSLHLLVGENDQLGAENLADTNSIWVSVGHNMASLSTAENTNIFDSLSLPASLTNQAIAARTFANSKQSMGGR